MNVPTEKEEERKPLVESKTDLTPSDRLQIVLIRLTLWGATVRADTPLIVMEDDMDPRVTALFPPLIARVRQIQEMQMRSGAPAPALDTDWETKTYSCMTDVLAIVRTYIPLTTSFTEEYDSRSNAYVTAHLSKDPTGIVMDYINNPSPDTVKQYWTDVERQLTDYTRFVRHEAHRKRIRRVDDWFERFTTFCACECRRSLNDECAENIVHGLNVCLCLPCLCAYVCIMCCYERKEAHLGM